MKKPPIFVVDTTNMTEERWLQVREHGRGVKPTDPDYIPYTITGSGASSALGVNPWVSDEEYRDKKMGIEPAIKTEFNEESKAAGHVFEPFVAINFLRYMRMNFPEAKINLKKDMLRDILPYLENACPDKKSYESFLKSYDKVIQSFAAKWGDLNPSFMYQCGEVDDNGELKYPFALANIDGLVEVNGKLGIFEAKTTSVRSGSIREYWEQGKIPEYYYWQLVFYMAVMNVDFAYICCIWGVTLNDMAVIYLERDLDVEKEFMDYLKGFVSDMEEGLPLDESNSDPELVSQYYYRLYGTAEKKPEAVELPAYCRSMVSKAVELDKEISEAENALKALKAKRTEIFNEIHPIMKDNAYATVKMEDDSVFGIKLKTSMKRPVFDTERFKAEQPELYQKYGEVSVNTTALEKEHKGMKKAYMMPPEPNPTGAPSFEIYEYSRKE